MTTKTLLEQQQQEANNTISKLHDEICEMAWDARQYVYDGKANEDTARKIFAINELQGEITFLTNHFYKLVETMDFSELVKKAESYHKHATTLMNKVEKEVKENN